jgi:DNA-binding transcriptional ArsR family regulator
MVLMNRNQRRRAPRTDELRDITKVHESACSDLLGSLRALYSPRTYPTMRGWAATTKKELPRELFEAGRFFFQGHDTSVGFGAVRLIPDLRDKASPESLIKAIRASEPVRFALYMLDSSGDTGRERMAAFRRVLEGNGGASSRTRALQGLSTSRRARYQRILENPDGVKSELADLLEQYNRLSFSKQLDEVRRSVAAAAKTARETLQVLPTIQAVEQLTGGYTISADVPLNRLTLVPSVFLYPFVAVRVDDDASEAMILYGVPSLAHETYDTVPIDQSLLRALKAMSDPARLQILRLLSERQVTGPQLVDLLGLSQPTLHHHIAALRAAELVRQERTRNGMLLALRDDGVKAFLTAVGAVFGPDGNGTDRARSGTSTRA